MLKALTEIAVLNRLYQLRKVISSVMRLPTVSSKFCCKREKYTRSAPNTLLILKRERLEKHKKLWIVSFRNLYFPSVCVTLYGL